MSLIKKLKKFFGKYSEEIDVVGDAFNVIASYLPIPPGERAIISAAAKQLKGGAKNVAESVQKLSDAAKDVPAFDLDDVVEALKPKLLEAVRQVVQEMTRANAMAVLSVQDAEVPEGAQTFAAGMVSADAPPGTAGDVEIKPPKASK